MSLYSPYGIAAPDAPLEPLSRCLFHLALNEIEWDASTGAVIARSGHTAVLTRAATASPADSRGTTYTAQHGQLALEARDWLNAGARQTLGLLLGTSDRLPFAIAFTPMAMMFYLEFIETGASAFRLSLGNAGQTGARLQLSASTGYTLLHNNGSTGVTTSAAPATSAGQRIALRLGLAATGAAQLWQSINGAGETTTGATAANALAAAWPASSSLYVGSLGSGTGGQGWLRRCKALAGVPTLTDLQTVA